MRIAHIAHIANIGAYLTYCRSYCAYIHTQRISCISQLLCVYYNHILRYYIILLSYRFHIYITWYVVTCTHITGLSNMQTNCFFFFDFQYTACYTNMPQHSEIFHKQPQYATNIIANMHIDISSSEEAYREDIDMCSRCDIYVFARIAHISICIVRVLSNINDIL